MWLSREIILRHGGSIRVRSSDNPVHRGTVVSIFLPFEGQSTGLNESYPASTEHAA
jgi:signal transduction histidine kinase